MKLTDKTQNFSSVDYLGAALAKTASQSPPWSVANQRLSAVQFTPTGKELLDILSKFQSNETPNDSKKAGEEVSDANPGLVALVNSWKQDWENDTFVFDKPIEIAGQGQGPSLEELIRREQEG